MNKFKYKINYIGGAFTCSTCKTTFSKREDFTKHLQDNPTHTNNASRGNARHGSGDTHRIYICTLCGFNIMDRQEFINHLDNESHRMISSTQEIIPVEDNYLGKLIKSCNQRETIIINIPSDREVNEHMSAFIPNLEAKRKNFMTFFSDKDFIYKIVTIADCQNAETGRITSRQVFYTIKLIIDLFGCFNSDYKSQIGKNFRERRDDFVTRDINQYLSRIAPGGILSLLKYKGHPHKKLFMYEILGLVDDTMIVNICDEYRKYYGKTRNKVSYKYETDYRLYIKANPDLLYIYELCRIFYITVRDNVFLSKIVYEIQ